MELFKNTFKKEEGPKEDLNSISKKFVDAIKSVGQIPANLIGKTRLYTVGLATLCSVTATSCNSGVFEDINIGGGVTIEKGIDTDGDGMPDGYVTFSVGGSTYGGWGISAGFDWGTMPYPGNMDGIQYGVEESLPNTGIIYISQDPNNMGGNGQIPGFGYHDFDQATVESMKEVYDYAYTPFEQGGMGYTQGTFYMAYYYEVIDTENVNGEFHKELRITGYAGY